MGLVIATFRFFEWPLPQDFPGTFLYGRLPRYSFAGNLVGAAAAFEGGQPG